MRVCPSCGNTYPDDANFCPMDATRLPPAVAATPAIATPAVTQPDHPAPIAGRFLMAGSGAPTPTGVAGEATDLQTGGAVLLKLVPPEVLPTPAMADRALRELKQLAKVTSDRIVRVIDQGKLADGRVYVATERVDGSATLEELVGREGALPLERARSIVLQVGEALTEAQKVGVIHRDVAPRNVFVGAGDRVKLADFGLAEAVNDRVFGAPAFLSPEQAEGKPVDQRSNIYSLGAVYYFALTGQAPFAGDAASLMQQHLSATPEAPSARRPGLGSDVDRVILKALEKSGGRRHLTLRQLLTEVGGAQAATAQPARADANARTMMGEAPQLAQPTPAAASAPAQPSSPPARAVAQTMMGIASPMAAMGPPATKAPPGPAQPTAPAVTAATATTAPTASIPAKTVPSIPTAAPQAPTVMAEAPRVPQPHAPQPQPPQQQPTMMAEASRAPQPPSAPAQPVTLMAEAPRPPAPTPAAPPPAAAAATAGKQNNQTGKKGAFRETAWFKRGEIEEEMAKAQAAAGDNPLKSGTTGQHAPVDESQVDLSSQDRQRLSLKTGATQAMPVVRAPQAALPGERMDEAEMLAEINPSKRYFMIAGAIVVAIVLGLLIYFSTRGSPKAEAPPPDKPAPVAAAPPAATPSATPPASTAPAPTRPTTPSPTPNPKPAAAAAVAAASASELAAAVDKLEASGGGDKREVKRLEKSLAADLKTAHKKKDRAAEAADKQLLARLKKLSKKK